MIVGELAAGLGSEGPSLKSQLSTAKRWEIGILSAFDPLQVAPCHLGATFLVSQTPLACCSQHRPGMFHAPVFLGSQGVLRWPQVHPGCCLLSSGLVGVSCAPPLTTVPLGHFAQGWTPAPPRRLPTPGLAACCPGRPRGSGHVRKNSHWAWHCPRHTAGPTSHTHFRHLLLSPLPGHHGARTPGAPPLNSGSVQTPWRMTDLLPSPILVQQLPVAQRSWLRCHQGGNLLLCHQACPGFLCH